MADEKKAPSEKKKDSFITKVGLFFKHLPANIARPFKNMWRELKLVTWPTRKDLISYTLIVLAFMVFMGVVIGLLDMGAIQLISTLAR